MSFNKDLSYLVLAEFIADLHNSSSVCKHGKKIKRYKTFKVRLDKALGNQIQL